MMITVGKLAFENKVEFKFRKDNIKIEKTMDEVKEIVIKTIEEENK